MSDNWNPTNFESAVEKFSSSSRVALVTTDCGIGYLKTADNPEGPLILAADWIGTKLAEFMSIPSLEVAKLKLDDIDSQILSEFLGFDVKMGTAFITKAERAETFSGEKMLELASNCSDIPKMVVLDTWIRNVDKYTENAFGTGRHRVNRDNLILTETGQPKGKWILKPIDFGLALDGPNMCAKLKNIDRIKDTRIYGCYPEFRNKFHDMEISAAFQSMNSVNTKILDTIISEVPDSWFGGDKSLRVIVKDFLEDRREYLLSDGREAIRAVLSKANQGELL